MKLHSHNRFSSSENNDVSQTIENGPDGEYNNYAITESYVVSYDDPNIENEETKETYESNEKIVVSADGEKWMNRVFRNSSTDPEMFTTAERTDDDSQFEVTTSLTSKLSSHIHQLDGHPHLVNYHHINSNACIACLALHAKGNDGKITSDDKSTDASSITTSMTMFEVVDKKATTKSQIFGTVAPNSNRNTEASIVKGQFIDEGDHRHNSNFSDAGTSTPSISTSSKESMVYGSNGELKLNIFKCYALCSFSNV